MQLTDQEKEKGRKAQRLILIVMIVFIVAPMLVYFLTHPSH
jgi:hypothetical protein